MPHTPVSTTPHQAQERNCTTPRKLHYDGSHGGAEENARNGVTQTQSTARHRTFTCRSEQRAPAQQLHAPLQSTNSSDSGSDCSVAKLKGWLDDFGKQNRTHSEKTNQVGQVPTGAALQKPIRPKVTMKASTKKSVKRSTDTMKESRKGPTMTPVRFKTRFDDKVKATDTGYASVKQLSAWLADDPTTTKANRGCVRRGINVINMSRKFDKDLEDVIIEEVGMEHGDVHDKKAWLQSAFGSANGDMVEPDFDQRSAVTELVSVQDKKKWLTGAFGDERRMSASVIEGGGGVRGSQSVVSVNDKREWLQRAFKKGSERALGTKDTATPAKEKWRRRRSSNRNLLSASKASPSRSSGVASTEAARVPSAAPVALKGQALSATPAAKIVAPPAVQRRTSPVEAAPVEVRAPSLEEIQISNSVPAIEVVAHSDAPRAESPIEPAPVVEPEEAEKHVSAAVPPSIVERVAPVEVKKAASPVEIAPVRPRDPSLERNQAPIAAPAAERVAHAEEVLKAVSAPVRIRAPLPTVNLPAPSAQRRSRFCGPQSTTTAPPLEARPTAAARFAPRSTYSSAQPSTRREVQPAPSPVRSNKRHETSNDQNCQSQPSAASESPVGFKAARLLLVQRSKANGNPVKVMTKVQMRKNKFEKWEKAQAKGSGPKGLLKPTWEQEDGDRRSSTQYAKSFLEDIAPKKSFRDLP